MKCCCYLLEWLKLKGQIPPSVGKGGEIWHCYRSCILQFRKWLDSFLRSYFSVIQYFHTCVLTWLYLCVYTYSLHIYLLKAKTYKGLKIFSAGECILNLQIGFCSFWKTEREREKVCTEPSRSAGNHHGQGRAEPETWSSVWVSHAGRRDLSKCSITCCLPEVHIRRTPDIKRGGRRWEQIPGTAVWAMGIPSCPKLLLQTPTLGETWQQKGMSCYILLHGRI